MDPSELLTIYSPLVSTVYHDWVISKRINLQRDEIEEVIKVFEENPNLLFWRNKSAADLIWDIYQFDHGNFHFNWGFMRNQSHQYYVLHTGYDDHKVTIHSK